MGQRLNIEIKKKGQDKILANCYYHWSAYTYSSLKLALDIINNIIDLKSSDTDTMKAIQLFQSTGGGLTEEEYNTLNEGDKKYCKVGQSRNLGLISITDKGIEETRKYEEGRLTIEIDFDNKDILFNKDKVINVDFDVCYPTDLEEVEERSVDIKKLIEFDFDLCNMSYKDLAHFINKLSIIEDKYEGLFKVKGQIYSSIY